MAGLSGPVRLLEQAIRYATGSVDSVVDGFGSLPTPCVEWDLHALLLHLNDSIAALQQGVEFGHVAVDESRGPQDPTCVLVTSFRSRVQRLLSSCRTGAPAGRLVTVDGVSLPTGKVVVTGAVEVAVHGWDISVACGNHRPIPDPLALGMLTLSQLMVDDGMRASLFGPPVAVSPLAGPSDQLVAFLGRHPVPSATSSPR
ncbi:maleylpyruvate isomerase family mycothiol-dependent enzyme [Kribbella sancticallisti]|uniref:Maleylpyruvate isomerase family mycothiol-dependent enzyme n=1 Tax=Kribbella sancticallisti TaxID=460087 RepID=A0ABN2DWT5_9ACTN